MVLRKYKVSFSYLRIQTNSFLLFIILRVKHICCLYVTILYLIQIRVTYIKDIKLVNSLKFVRIKNQPLTMLNAFRVNFNSSSAHTNRILTFGHKILLTL